MSTNLSRLLVTALVGILLVGIMVSGATANHEQVHCSGCVDKPDISKDAVGGWEILNGSVGPADLAANAKTRMWASTESGSAAFVEAGIVLLNEIDITAPTNGFLTISGTVFVWNEDTADGTFFVDALLDGGPLPIAGFNGQAKRTMSGGVDDTLAYTVTVPVEAGAHTLSQAVEGNSSDWSVSDPYFTVTFTPGPLGSVETSTSSTSLSEELSLDAETPLRTR